MAHTLEHGPEIRQVRVGQVFEGIGSGQALEHLGIQVQRQIDSAVVFDHEQLFVTEASWRTGCQCGEQAPVRHQEVADVLLEFHVVEPAQLALDGPQEFRASCGHAA